MMRGYTALLMSICSVGLSAAETSVETEVRKAFEEAGKKLPEPFLERVRDVRIVRNPDLGLPADLPLEYRLLNRAAYASLSVNERELSVYDAGATGVPTWGAGGAERGL